MGDAVITGLEIKNPPSMLLTLYRKVFGPSVKITDELVLPLSGGLPEGDPIGEIYLDPRIKSHRIAYRAILRDAVARRLRELGARVSGKYAVFCNVRFIYDVTYSGDKRILTAFPQDDVDPLKALSLVAILKERLGYVELQGRPHRLAGPVRLKSIRGGKFPDPRIVLLDSRGHPRFTDDPVRAFKEGRGRALEGGEDLGKRLKVRVFSDSKRLLARLYEFSERFLHGYAQRPGYSRLMRTPSEIVETDVTEPESIEFKPGEAYFLAFTEESDELYRSIRERAIARRAIVQMFKVSSLKEFYEGIAQGKLCGLAALAIDVHKKFGLAPYKLDSYAIFDADFSVVAISSASGRYIAVKHTSDGRFVESIVTEALSDVEATLREGDIVYSQGVREFRRSDGAVLYVDRKTPVGILESLRPARGTYFLTPREGFVVTGFNCRALRVRVIRSRNYRPYKLVLYTYRSSRLLQRDFPVLVPPAIRDVDRIREHIEKNIFVARADRPRFLRAPCRSPTP